jgi:O-antigen/teichoic acid export membrane protein
LGGWSTIKIKKYFLFGFSVALDRNIGSLYTTLPLLIAAAFIPTEQVAFFKIAVGFVGLPAIFLGPISRLLNVQLPQSKALSYEHLKTAFNRTIKGSFLVAVVLALGAVILAKPLIILFYGQQFEASSVLVPILALDILFSGLSVANGPMFRTLNKMKTIISMNVAFIVLGSPILYFVIKSFGVFGLAWSYVLWSGLANVCAFLVLRKNLKSQLQA